MSAELGQFVVLFMTSMGFGVLVAFSRVEAGRDALFVSSWLGLALLLVVSLAQGISLVSGYGFLPMLSEPILYGIVMMLALFGGFGLGGWLMLRPLR